MLHRGSLAGSVTLCTMPPPTVTCWMCPPACELNLSSVSGCWESDHIQVNEQGAGTLGCRCQNRYENPKSKLFSLVSGREPDNGAGEGGLSWYPVGCMLERGQQSRGCEPLTWRPEVGGCSPVAPITPSQGGLVGASEAPRHV